MRDWKGTNTAAFEGNQRNAVEAISKQLRELSAAIKLISKNLQPTQGGNTFIVNTTEIVGPLGANAGFTTSDQAFASSTPADVNNLSFPVISGTYYFYVFKVGIQSSALTVGPILTVTTPAVSTFTGRAVGPVGVDGVASTWQGEITASGDIVTFPDVNAINTTYLYTVEGLLLPAADGDIKLQLAREGSTGTITSKRGSVGILYEIG